MPADSDVIPAQVLEAYGFELQAFERATSGLIHQTWIIETRSAERYVLQHLHAMIGPDVTERIQAVTQRLQQQGLCTPALVQTTAGEYSVRLGQESWRVLTYVPGDCFDTVPSVEHARGAGQMLARFHTAGVDWEDLICLPVSTTHGISHYLEILQTALKNNTHRKDHAKLAKFADEIFGFARTLPKGVANPPRMVHGDPKLSNVLFDPGGVAVCLVDLDTVGLMDLVWELGDAFRSWCNPHGEDTKDTNFSLEIFEHAVYGYATIGHRFISPEEVDGIVPAVLTIYTELAARFCTDALLECYFGWDAAQFSSRSAHNLVRAQGQMNAARDLLSKRMAAEQIVERVFGTTGT